VVASRQADTADLAFKAPGRIFRLSDRGGDPFSHKKGRRKK
jgi:hypothetical protein